MHFTARRTEAEKKVDFYLASQPMLPSWGSWLWDSWTSSSWSAAGGSPRCWPCPAAPASAWWWWCPSPPAGRSGSSAGRSPGWSVERPERRTVSQSVVRAERCQWDVCRPFPLPPSFPPSSLPLIKEFTRLNVDFYWAETVLAVNLNQYIFSMEFCGKNLKCGFYISNAWLHRAGGLQSASEGLQCQGSARARLVLSNSNQLNIARPGSVPGPECRNQS